jgi:hypothetical protein
MNWLMGTPLNVERSHRFMGIMQFQWNWVLPMNRHLFVVQALACPDAIRSPPDPRTG